MHDNKKLTVINMLSGPSVGKSTVSTFVFGHMKRAGFKVEFAPEVAKDYVWESWAHIFSEQDYIFGQQHRLIRRLVRHDVDYVVSDSSLLLGLLYMPPSFPTTFAPFLREVYDTYDNINIYLERNPAFPYVETGRNQTYAEAVQKDRDILKLLSDENIPFHLVMSGDDAPLKVFDIVKEHHKTKKFG